VDEPLGIPADEITPCDLNQDNLRAIGRMHVAADKADDGASTVNAIAEADAVGECRSRGRNPDERQHGNSGKSRKGVHSFLPR
jgi:hypothetical protein